MPKLLFLNRVFGSEAEATGMLLAELAEDLASENEVTVIAARPHSQGRRIWPLVARERHGAVRVIRTFALNISKRRAILRYLDSFVFLGLAACAALFERPDVLIAETDPPLLGLLGVMLRFLWRCPFVYYCQDVYPDVGVASGALKSRVMEWLVRWSNRLAYDRADAIVVLSPDMAGLLRRKGVPADKIAIIPNWIDCHKVKPQSAPPDSEKPLSVMYAGNLGWTQNLECVLDAAHLMRDDRRVRFVIVGGGARKIHLQTRAKHLQLTNVVFRDRVEALKLSEMLAAGDLHLIPLGAGVAGCMVPSKIYGILAAGRPFVAMMEKHAEVARIAVEAAVGFVVAPGDAAALARTIGECMADRELLDAMGLRARALAETAYDRAIVTRRFTTFLAAVLSGEPLSARDAIDTTPAIEIGEGVAIPAK
jgi:putative colanic acid biosynthesis glycosyltransferase WcaI